MCVHGAPAACARAGPPSTDIWKKWLCADDIFRCVKKHRFLSEKSLFLSCLGPACCAFSVRVCVCLCVCLCVCACASLCVTPVCPFKASACEHSKRPRVCRHRAHMCFNMCAWCRYTRGRCECTHGKRCESTHGEQGRVILRIGPRIFHRGNK